MDNFILDILFPKFCFGCKREGSYLCQDCFSTIEILEYQFCPICKSRLLPFPHPQTSSGYNRAGVCKKCRGKTKLSGLFAATSYQNPLVKKMISGFKYQPFIKELSKPSASFIIAHFFLLKQNPLSSSHPDLLESTGPAFKNISNFILVPVPLAKSREKWRGFNQAEEITKELSKFFKIPIEKNNLIKIRETKPQIELKGKERQENIKGVFLTNHPELIKNKKILLVDDVYTTGSTMAECARVLKEEGAKEIWGIVVARE